ncbi:MAG: TolC family protein [Muribaculaceae bacterium]|nr:TolC family protein [Muribaculaceae bacterium]
MNNRRLLAGLLVVALSGIGARAYGQVVTTLEEVFEMAEANSLQLRPSLAAELEARQEISVAGAKRLPDINVGLSLSYIGNGFITKRDFTDYQTAHIPHFGNTLGISVAQPVYTGGAITAGIEMAELKLTAARYATELQRDNLRMQLTGFYLDIYKYCNLRAVVESNIAQAGKVLAEMRARYEQGVALQNDITRYELLVSNLELQLVKINNLISILNDNLVTIAGFPEGIMIQPDSALLSRSLPSQSAEAWQTDALANSPTIKLARSGVDLSLKGEQLARAERLPNVGLQAGWNFDGPILTEVPPINRNLSYWYVGVGVTYNLSSLYKTNKSVSRSRAATAQAHAALDAAQESTELVVHADYVRYLEAYEELNTQNKNVELADRNYATVFARYSEGTALITDMLDAANTKLDAEQQLVNARINIIYYYYKLLFTSGKI